MRGENVEELLTSAKQLARENEENSACATGSGVLTLQRGEMWLTIHKVLSNKL
jgi:hypothetical protein